MTQAVVLAVAHQEAAHPQLLPDRVDRADHALVVVGDEVVAREEQQGSVHLLAPEHLHEHAAVRVIALALDRLPDLVPRAAPSLGGSVEVALLRELQTPVERRPAHDLRVHEVERVAGPFPDAAVGLAPALRRGVDQVANEGPRLVIGRVAALVPAPGDADELAEGIELQLGARTVTDVHGS